MLSADFHGFYSAMMKFLGAEEFHFGYLEIFSLISHAHSCGKVLIGIGIFVIVPDCNFGNIAGVRGCWGTHGACPFNADVFDELPAPAAFIGNIKVKFIGDLSVLDDVGEAKYR